MWQNSCHCGHLGPSTRLGRVVHAQQPRSSNQCPTRIQRLAVALAAVVLLGGGTGPGRPLEIYFIDVMGRGDADRDPRAGVAPDRLGLAGLRGPRPEADRARPEGRGRARPPRPPGDDPLAQRPFRRRRGARRSGSGSTTSGTAACPTRTPPTATRPTSPTARSPTTRWGSPIGRRREGKRQALKAGDTLPLKGDVEVVVLASGGEVIEAPAGAGQPALRRGPARPAGRPDRQRPEPGLPVPARQVRLPRLRRPDLERREGAGLPGRPDRADRPLPGDAPRDGDLEPPDPGPDDRADGRHHEQRPAQGGRRATVKLLRSIPSIQAAYQLHKNAATGADENTDPALIANADPAGGQFIHVAVAPDGSSFTVQIGADGPERTFKSR